VKKYACSKGRPKPGTGNAVAFCAVLAAILFLAGCGKKGPPVPPDIAPPPPVENLKANLSGNRAQLSWEAPESGDSAAEPDGYLVYRSKKSAESDCGDCPDIFEKVADVSAKTGIFRGLADTATYSETLEKGYVYRYKVMVYSDRGPASDYSNTVEVSFR
jgi:predicted small lipoprotein YifL